MAWPKEGYNYRKFFNKRLHLFNDRFIRNGV